MAKTVNPSRRNVLKRSLTGVAGAAAANLALPRRAKAAIEKDGRPVILAFMGQHCHNPIFMELNLRNTLAKMNWRVFFTQYGEFVTPENIAKADVLITLAANNTYTSWSVGYTPDGLIEERPPPQTLHDRRSGGRHHRRYREPRHGIHVPPQLPL